MRHKEFPIEILIYVIVILFWLGLYIYDCVKLHRIPSCFKSVREKWWIYALAIITIILVLSQLKSCASELYDRGYESGYEAGIEEGIALAKEDPANYLDW